MKEEPVETANKLAEVELEDIKEKTRKIIEWLQTYITPTRQDNSFHSNPNYIIEIKVFISLLKKHILKEPVDKDFPILFEDKMKFRDNEFLYDKCIKQHQCIINYQHKMREHKEHIAKLEKTIATLQGSPNSIKTSMDLPIIEDISSHDYGKSKIYGKFDFDNFANIANKNYVLHRRISTANVKLETLQKSLMEILKTGIPIKDITDIQDVLSGKDVERALKELTETKSYDGYFTNYNISGDDDV